MLVMDLRNFFWSGRKSTFKALHGSQKFFWGGGEGREGKGREWKGREGRGREGKGREGKGRKGEGRERTGREGKGYISVLVMDHRISSGVGDNLVLTMLVMELRSLFWSGR